MSRTPPKEAPRPTVRDLAKEAAARVKAENQAARASRQLGQLRTVLEATPDVVVVDGIEGFDYLNPAARQFFGIGDEVVSVEEPGLASLVARTDREAFARAVERVASEGTEFGG